MYHRLMLLHILVDVSTTNMADVSTPIQCALTACLVAACQAANGIHHAAANGPATMPAGLHGMPSPPQRGARERELREARDQLAGDASEVG